MDIPVVLPHPLPSGTHLDPQGHLFVRTVPGGRRAAQLQLVFGAGGHLIIQYGVAVFEGRGGDDAVPTKVGGMDALIYQSPDLLWTELIWPATPDHPEGKYGLSGTLPRSVILALARSMSQQPAKDAAEVGC
jgi:hypothetical protein